MCVIIVCCVYVFSEFSFGQLIFCFVISGPREGGMVQETKFCFGQISGAGDGVHRSILLK